MKFGINCRYDELLKEETIKDLKKKGIKFVEIRCPPEHFNQHEIDFIKGQFEYSMHASFENLKINILPRFSYSIEGINKLKKDIDLAILLNVKEVVVHGGAFFKGYIRLSNILKKNIGLNFFLDLFIKTFSPIFKEANDNGIKIVIENCYPCFLFGRPYDILYVKQKLPSLGFCLDLAHSEIYNQTMELMRLGIDHIHLTDNDKKTDQHLVIGNGSIDFDDFFSRLKKKNYNQKIILECENLQDSLNSFNNIRSISKKYE